MGIKRKMDLSQITDDPEMLETLQGESTLGKQAAQVRPLTKKEQGAADKAKMDAMWERVDKSRAAKGLPSLPKYGSKEARR